MGKQKDYFAIFAGGGVRGTAYIGALKALEELNINLTGYASSSVGAIIASLISVGYNHAELKDLLFNINYQKFQDLYLPFGKDFGFFKGDGVYYWLKKNIEKKFYENKDSEKKPVTFHDVDKDLIIIATDVSNGGFKEYSRIKTPDIEIAHAVRASISIPGFFKPVWENDKCLVDGDIINNFPVWKDSSDILANTNSKILEFRLEGSEKPKEISCFLDYFSAILETSYNISTDILEAKYGKNDQFDIIRIDAGKIKIIDFNISNNHKEELIINGFDSVKKYFSYDLVKKKRNINKIYEKILDQLKDLKEFVSWNNATDCSIIMGSLCIYFAENKDYIHRGIYGQFIELQGLLSESVYSFKFFKLNILRNRKNLTARVIKLIGDLQTFIKF